MSALPPQSVFEEGEEEEVDGRSKSKTHFTASTLRAGVDKWCITAIEIAKSKMPFGCGRERLSATTTSCGSCCFAILTRFVELPWISILARNTHAFNKSSVG
jgi:hypothetical protein